MAIDVKELVSAMAVGKCSWSSDEKGNVTLSVDRRETVSIDPEELKALRVDAEETLKALDTIEGAAEKARERKQ
jgi:RPA family protein